MRKFKNYEMIGLARELTMHLYAIVRQYPKEEQYTLAQQIRRAAVSVGANIAEGSGRTSRKDFAHFLTQAIGSISELEYLLLISMDLGFISIDQQRQSDRTLQLLKSKIHLFRESLLKTPA